MKKYVNGQYIELTEKEITEMKAEAEKVVEEQKNTPPTETERLEALEQAFMELVEVVVNG